MYNTYSTLVVYGVGFRVQNIGALVFYTILRGFLIMIRVYHTPGFGGAPALADLWLTQGCT